MKNLKKIVLVFVIAVLTAAFYVNASLKSEIAQASETCPEGNGWTKVDGINALSYVFTLLPGQTVTDNCIKVGSHAPLFGTGATVQNTTLFNSPGNLPQGQVCTAPGVPVSGCSLQNISHASFKVVVSASPTPTNTPSATPTPTDTPRVSPTPTDIPYVSPTPTLELSVTPEPTSYISPTPTPGGQGGPECDDDMIYDANLNICISCPGDGDCEVVIGASPTPAPTTSPTSAPTVAPTATPVPAQGGTSSSNSSSNSSSSESKSEPAAVTAFANTGNFANSASNAVFAIGASLSALSAAWYGKKKKTSKKK